MSLPSLGVVLLFTVSQGKGNLGFCCFGLQRKTTHEGFVFLTWINNARIALEEKDKPPFV